MLGIIWQQQIARRILASFLIGILSLGLWGCGDAKSNRASRPSPSANTLESRVGRVAEVSPPAALQELKQALEGFQPQVKILSPKPNEVLKVDSVSVRFQVSDFPAFKDETLQLGPHLHVFLDNQPYQALYDPSQPLTFEGLTPGTHTIRAFASRPWHESFKNEGAYAHVTFHVFAETPDNNPTPDQPLLTYSRPQGTYGAEPVMLDYYLSNVPLHLIAQERSDDDILDWRIRCTVNGESFLLDTWEPIYLKGLKPGQNWVQLELVDENGNLFPNPFNNTVRLINYEPGGQDTLSRLVRGELTAAAAMGIVDPNYIPELPASEPVLTPEPSAVEKLPELEPVEPTPEPDLVEPTLEPEVVEPAPEPEPAVPVVPPAPEPILLPDLEVPPVEEFPVEIGPEEAEEEPSPAPLPAPVEDSNKLKGFFNRFRRATPDAPVPLPSPAPVTPETPESPQEGMFDTPELPASEPEVPAVQTPMEEEPAEEQGPGALPAPVEDSNKLKGFFNRFRRATPETPAPLPGSVPVEEGEQELPADEGLPATPEEPTTESEIPEVTPPPSPEGSQIQDFFNRFRRITPAIPDPTPSDLPEVEPSPTDETLPDSLSSPERESDRPESEEATPIEEAEPELESPSEPSPVKGFLDRFRQTIQNLQPSPSPSPASIPSPVGEPSVEPVVIPDVLTAPEAESEIPEVEEPDSSELLPEQAPALPSATPNPTDQVKGFFNRFRSIPSAAPLPESQPIELPQVEESDETSAEIPGLETPEPESSPLPAEPDAPEASVNPPGFSRFFERFKPLTEPAMPGSSPEPLLPPEPVTSPGLVPLEQPSPASDEAPAVDLEPAIPPSDELLPSLFEFPATPPAPKPSPQIPDIGEFLNRFRLPVNKPSKPLDDVVPLLFPQKEAPMTTGETLEEAPALISPETPPDLESGTQDTTPLPEIIRPEPPQPTGSEPSLGQFFKRLQPVTPAPMAPTPDLAPAFSTDETVIQEGEEVTADDGDTLSPEVGNPIELAPSVPASPSSPSPSLSFKDFLNRFQGRPASEGITPSPEPIPDVLEAPTVE